MKIDLKKILNEEIPDYKKFHDKVKLKKTYKIKDYKYWPKSWKTVFFKAYPRFEEIILSKPKLPAFSLEKALLNRKSTRIFSKDPLRLSDLSSLLYYSAGLKSKTGKQKANRFYPSGGSCYPLEVYIISLNSELPKGIYHYYLKSHSLEKILDMNEFNYNEYFIYDWVADSSALVIITAVLNRSTIKYQDRGYFLALIELGALMQNFYLNSGALKIGICAVAGFVEDKLNKLLGIEQHEEIVLGVVGIGYKVHQSS